MFFIIFYLIYLFQFSKNYIIPSISIIVPIYNVDQYLKQCLISLIFQTLKNIEIICVNDGSSDSSLEIITQFISDQRIIILNKTNTGYGDSMNQGIEFASGQYIGIIEPDDFVNNFMFEYLYNHTNNNEMDIVRSNYYFYWNENEIKPNHFEIINSLYNKVFNPISNPNVFFITPSIWAAIYKKDLLIKNNIKFLTTPGASYQDISFFFKTMFKSNKIFFSDKRLLYYRLTNPNSSIKNKSLQKAFFVHKEIDEIEKYIQRNFTSFKKIEKYFNTVKLINYLWNLWRIEKKEKYIRFFHQGINKILKDDNYFHKQFNSFENKFLIYLKEFGEKIALDFYLNKFYYLNNIKKSKFPKVSIIIPIYNSENYLYDSLNTILNQTLKEIEIICINDGSFDNSLKILNFFKEIDKRIIIINQKHKGINSARNAGLEIAKGEFILFFDSEDKLASDALEKLFILSKNNNLELVYFNVDLVFENNKSEEHFFPYNLYYSIDQYKIIKNKKDLFLNLINKNKWISSPCFQFIKHSLLLKCKIKFFENIYVDDYLFTFKLMNSFTYALELNKKLYFKIFHDNFHIETDILVKTLHDYIICIYGLFLQLKKYYKDNIIQHSLELFINHLEEKVFFIFRKIKVYQLILLDKWKKYDKILLLSILQNKSNNLYFMREMFKKNEKFFYISILFNNFEKTMSFKISYKINEIKKTQLFEDKYKILKKFFLFNL